MSNWNSCGILTAMISDAPAPPRVRWLNRTVLGIALASLFSDWSHEIATTVMPAFLATMGVAAAWLGLIEGVSTPAETRFVETVL